MNTMGALNVAGEEEGGRGGEFERVIDNTLETNKKKREYIVKEINKPQQTATLTGAKRIGE